jgi:hypothetical protein
MTAGSVKYSIRTSCDLATASIISPEFRQVAARHSASRASGLRRFKTDPTHPSLQFKKLHSTLPLWSVRVTGSYRAVGVRRENSIVGFFIGTHADYDRRLNSLP